MKRSAIVPVMVMHASDNVAVCIRELKQGDALFLEQESRKIQLKVKEPIPLGHKIALGNIDRESPVVKYGEIIGKATRKIVKGQHVHIHNVTDY